MSADTPHLSDERLLLLVDGELLPRHAEAARHHLRACPPCRARFERIEASAAEFSRAYRGDVDADLSGTAAASRSRDALKTQLADITRQGRRGPSWVTASALLVAALVGLEFVSSRSVPPAAPVARHTTVRPIAYLTPGATRPVAVADVCASRRAAPRVIPARVRQAVVRDYSMEHVPAHDYELDYLITPELGGSDDRRNLWPEHYSSDSWNARVKDELEASAAQARVRGHAARSRPPSATWPRTGSPPTRSTSTPIGRSTRTHPLDSDDDPRSRCDPRPDVRAAHAPKRRRRTLTRHVRSHRGTETPRGKQVDRFDAVGLRSRPGLTGRGAQTASLPTECQARGFGSSARGRRYAAPRRILCASALWLRDLRSQRDYRAAGQRASSGTFGSAVICRSAQWW